MRNPNTHFYEFGPFRFDPDRHRLTRNGDPISLPPRATMALRVLVENRGKLLEREALLKAVWAGTFVEDANLTVAISQLRKALGQNGDASEYIETIPRVGYRFVAEVRTIAGLPLPLIVEKLTHSQTVIEEEFYPETETGSLEKSVRPTRPAVVGLRRLITNHKVAALLTLTVMAGAALGTTVYLRPGQRQLMAAPNRIMRPVRSLAVLPPRTLGTKDDDSALSLGMADALITKLAGLHKISVRPTSSIAPYVDQNAKSTAIGRALGVDAVLDGTLQQQGGRARLTLQLIEVSTDTELWAGKFEEADADIFKLQDSASEKVAEVLSLNLNQSDRVNLTKRPTQNPEAYALYLKGSYFWAKRGNESVKSVNYLRKAIELDPGFAQAYVTLASAEATAGIPSPEAEALIQRALQLDNNLAEAHATYGFIRMFHHWDWEGARQALDYALELNPDSPVAHHWKGVYFSLLGRLDDAKAEMHRALELDPLSLIITADLGQLHYFAHEYDQALDYCNRALALDPSFEIAHLYLFDIYRMKGMEEDALRQLAAAERSGMRGEVVDRAAEAYVKAGMRSTMQNHIKGFLNNNEADQKLSALKIAQFYSILGDNEQALRWLSVTPEKPNFLMPYMNVDPIYDQLRGDPRFQSVLERMSLRPTSN